jgi:predicted nucleic acid-binding protein
MTISIDTNVLIGLWDKDPAMHIPARHALDSARKSGAMAISGCVYAELLAGQGRSIAALDELFIDTDIVVEWEMSEQIWKRAGEAFRSYSARRRRSHPGSSEPRRILTDFLIGAHAEVNGYVLLTFDQRLFKASFPGLRLSVI